MTSALREPESGKFPVAAFEDRSGFGFLPVVANVPQYIHRDLKRPCCSFHGLSPFLFAGLNVFPVFCFLFPAVCGSLPQYYCAS